MARLARFEALKELPAGSITASYLPIGAVTTYPWRKFTIKNTTEETLYVTTDNSEDEWKLPTLSYVTEDVTANRDKEQEIIISAKTQFYVKHAGAAPSLGDVIVEGGLYT